MGPKKNISETVFGTLFLWDVNGHSIKHLLWSCLEPWRARLPHGRRMCLGVGCTGMVPTALRADPQAEIPQSILKAYSSGHLEV